MNAPVQAQVVDEFNAGKWRMMIVTQPGEVQVVLKDGSTVDVRYMAGCAVLADAGDSVIAGPISLEGAVDLAERVLDCNSRVSTDPSTLLCLATALVAFAERSGPPRIDPSASQPTAISA